MPCTSPLFAVCEQTHYVQTTGERSIHGDSQHAILNHGLSDCVSGSRDYFLSASLSIFIPLIKRKFPVKQCAVWWSHTPAFHHLTVSVNSV